MLRPDNTTLRNIIVHTATNVIARLFYIVVRAGAVCLLLGLCMRWEKLDFKRPQEGCYNHATLESSMKEPQIGKRSPMTD